MSIFLSKEIFKPSKFSQFLIIKVDNWDKSDNFRCSNLLKFSITSSEPSKFSLLISLLRWIITLSFGLFSLNHSCNLTTIIKFSLIHLIIHLKFLALIYFQKD